MSAKFMSKEMKKDGSFGAVGFSMGLHVFNLAHKIDYLVSLLRLSEILGFLNTAVGLQLLPLLASLVWVLWRGRQAQPPSAEEEVPIVRTQTMELVVFRETRTSMTSKGRTTTTTTTRKMTYSDYGDDFVDGEASEGNVSGLERFSARPSKAVIAQERHKAFAA